MHQLTHHWHRRFWGKMDALMIRSFGTSPNVISKLSSGPSKASYAFFTVVRRWANGVDIKFGVV